MKFEKIWSRIKRVIYHNMKIFFTIFCHAYRLDHQCYDAEIFSDINMLLKVDCFEEFVIWSKIDRYMINNTSRCNL